MSSARPSCRSSMVIAVGRFFGELYLHLGITTCATIEIYQDGPWTLAQRDGTNAGKIRGPRIWTSGRAIGGGRTETDAPDSREFRGNIVVTTSDEARAAVDRKKQLGYDLIKLNEFLPMDLVKVVTDEAHKVGLAVTTHSWDAIGSANAGVDGIEHIWSVGYSSSRVEAAQLAKQACRTDRRGLPARGTRRKTSTPSLPPWWRSMSAGHRPSPNGCVRYHLPSMERFRQREHEIPRHRIQTFRRYCAP